MSELYNNTISHLKQINFALLVLTTIVVVMSMLVEKSKLESAIEDLVNLKAAFTYKVNEKPKPKFDDTWLIELAKEELAQARIAFKPYFISRPEIKDSFIKLNYQGFLIESAKGLYHESLVNQSRGFPALNGDRTLEEIKRFWDGLNTTSQIVYLESLEAKRFQYSTKDKELGYYDIEIHSDPKKAPVFTPSGPSMLVDTLSDTWFEQHLSNYKKYPSLEEDSRRAILNGGGYRYFIQGFESSGNFGFNFSRSAPTVSNVFAGHLMVPARVNYQKFSPLDSLVQQVPEKFDWSSGTFTLNFNELDKFTQGFQDIPLSKIQIILENELKRTSGAVNAFGLSLPFEILSKLGALAILSMHVYFLFYLRFFHSHFKHQQGIEENVPWIYLHRRLDTQIVFYMISVIYPGAVALKLAHQNIGHSEGWDFVMNISVFAAEYLVLIGLTYLVIKHRKDVGHLQLAKE